MKILTPSIKHREASKMIGKEIRLERIMNRNTNRTIIVPLDHGVTVGPIEGLVDMKVTINSIVEGGTNAIILHKGVVRSGHRHSGQDIGLIIHLSASTSLGVDPNAKVDVCTVEEAIQLGADAVSIHINLGAETEGDMLRHFGVVSKECTHWGMPLLAMMYTRGKKIQNEYDVKVVKHAARVGAELGADIVKVNYTGNSDSFHEVVQGCPVPVIIAGGEKMETDEEVLNMVKGTIKAGGSGVSFGRNVFQHKDPSEILKKIAKVVHQ